VGPAVPFELRAKHGRTESPIRRLSGDGPTTVPITGIGTQVGAISTHADSVTYSAPVLVEIPGVPGRVYEMKGTISGVGWGGAGSPVTRPAANAHYTYTFPFVARWRQHGGGKTLVAYHHGGSQPVVVITQADRLRGAENVHRVAELTGDQAAGVPTLVNNGTYLSMNRRGLTSDGRFSAKFLTTEVAPLTQAEVDAARAAIAPGDPTYQHPDLFAGAPVPTVPAVDTATFRDVNRALQQVVGDVSGKNFREKIAVSTSSGSVMASGMAFGGSAIGAANVRTGGNHTVPYDTTSPRIFDAFIFNGFVYNSNTPRADAAQPLDAPVFFIQGRGDERYQQPIRMAHELMEKGVTLDGNVWVYEIANFPHILRDNTRDVPPDGQNGEAIGPFYGAAIRNMRELLAGEAAPPQSHIAGRLIDGKLVFDVVGGTTNQMPVREDPSLDTVQVSAQLTIRTVDVGLDAGATARWQAVTAALDHDDDPIIGPSLAARIGGYQLRFFGTGLTPFSPDELAARYGSFNGYRAAVSATVEGLSADDLYDPRVESAHQTAERARPLFG
jgi:hypothetical protein